MYYCELCTNEVYYALSAVEKCIAKFGAVLCTMCRKKTKNGNMFGNVFN